MIKSKICILKKRVGGDLSLYMMSSRIKAISLRLSRNVNLYKYKQALGQHRIKWGKDTKHSLRSPKLGG